MKKKYYALTENYGEVYLYKSLNAAVDDCGGSTASVFEVIFKPMGKFKAVYPEPEIIKVPKRVIRNEQ